MEGITIQYQKHSDLPPKIWHFNGNKKVRFNSL